VGRGKEDIAAMGKRRSRGTLVKTIKSCEDREGLLVSPGETAIIERDLSDNKVLDGLVEGVSERCVELAVALIRRAADKIKIAQQDPGATDSLFGVTLEEMRGERMVRGTIGVGYSEVEVRGIAGEGRRKAVGVARVGGERKQGRIPGGDQATTRAIRGS
jgi:hypothetical protein